MIRITATIAIEEAEIQETFVRSSGPGGQNVNKVATAVCLRFDAAHSPSLPPRVRSRLVNMADRRMSAKGVLTIRANRFRGREQNRKDALERLIGLVRRAAEKRRFRVPTRPSAGSRQRRLDAKRRRSVAKHRRRAPTADGW